MASALGAPSLENYTSKYTDFSFASTFTLAQMLQTTLPIRPLPLEVAAQIQSSVAIPSLSYAILGLVNNSLDAEATKIAISVDFGRGACCIEDDGCGIAPKDFAADGGLGKPYRKSERFRSLYLSHKEARYFKVHGGLQRRPWHLSILSSCSVNPYNHIPPPCLQLYQHSCTPSFQSRSKIDSSAFSPTSQLP